MSNCIFVYYIYDNFFHNTTRVKKIIMEYKHINTDYLMDATGGDISIIKEIIGIFKDQVADSNIKMVELFEQKNYEELGHLAHKMKSSVAILGMDKLATTLKTFEIQTRTAECVEMYPEYIKMFKEETAAAFVELDDYIATH